MRDLVPFEQFKELLKPATLLLKAALAHGYFSQSRKTLQIFIICGPFSLLFFSYSSPFTFLSKITFKNLKLPPKMLFNKVLLL